MYQIPWIKGTLKYVKVDHFRESLHALSRINKLSDPNPP